MEEYLDPFSKSKNMPTSAEEKGLTKDNQCRTRGKHLHVTYIDSPNAESSSSSADTVEVTMSQSVPGKQRMVLVDYPELGNDPDPIPSSDNRRQFVAHLKELQDYEDAMYTKYNQTTMYGRSLWADLVQAFRPHTFQALSRPMATE